MAPPRGSGAPRRPDPEAPLRRPALIWMAVLVPAVLVVLLWPTHFLLWFKPGTLAVLDWLHGFGVLGWLTWGSLEVISNIGMIVPLALVLVLALGGRRWWWAVLAIGLGSIAVEIVQMVMPHRVGSAWDVLANTIGALLGAAIALVCEAIAIVRARRRGR